jgi:hypothetical protein
VATVGGSTSNSYVTRANAQTYFDGRLDVDEWTNASGADKDRSLIMATYRLEHEEFPGTKAAPTSQALEWPRYGTYDQNGTGWDSDEIPTPIERACCELAIALLKSPTLLADTGLEGFKQVGIGGGAVAVQPRASFKGGKLPATVRRLLSNGRIWIGRSGVSGPLVRG